jgi:starch phosphorylase
VQIVVAGKAHPNDGAGKAMVQAMVGYANRPDLRDHVVFLEDYDMVLALLMVGGVDVWINTPRRPMEACGTSGMKVLVNGGLNLSTLDGWWAWAYSPEVGWQIGDGVEAPGGERDDFDANQLYERLEREIVPEFYDRDTSGVPARWVARVRRSMTELSVRFSSHRMVRDYVQKAYLPACEGYRRRMADDGALARELERWHARVEEGWRGLRFVSVRTEEAPEGHRFDLQVYLGDLSPEDVRVEVFADAMEGHEPLAAALSRAGEIPGAHNGHRYAGTVPADRPVQHFTPRVVPHHPDASVPLECPRVFWG